MPLPPQPPRVPLPGHPAYEKPPGGGQGGVIFMAVVAGVLVLIGIGVAWRVAESRKLPAVVAEDTAQKHRNTEQAFDSGGLPDAQEAPRIKLCIDLFAAAVSEHDGAKLDRAFDFDRLFQELERNHATDAVPRNARSQFEAGIRQGMKTAVMQKSVPVSRHDIKHVKFSDDRREAVVYTRDLSDDGTQTKTRFWVRRTGSTWRIFDMESLDGGLRVSTLMVAGVKMATVPGAQPANLQKLISAMQQAQAGNVTQAKADLESVKGVQFPAEFEPVRGILWAGIHASEEHFELVLADCDTLEASGADVPMVHEFRAIAFNKLKQFDKALGSARKWKEALGGDLEVYYEMGIALAGLGRKDEAATAFGQSLDDDPDAVNSMKELAKTLPASRKSEIGDRFARCKKPKVVFADVAPVLQKARQLDALDSLLAAYKRTGTDDPWLDYYTGELHIVRKQFADGEQCLKPLLSKAPSVKAVDLFNQEYLYAATKAGHAVEAYRNVSDQRKAFREQTNWMETDKVDATRIRQLIDEHRIAHADDPWLAYRDGKMHAAAAKYDAAEASYSQAAEKAPASDQVAILSARVFARYKNGQSLKAYAELRPQRAVFVQLAKLYVQARDAEGLEKLVDAHSENSPGDAYVALYQAEVKYLRGQYASVADLLGENKAALVNDESTRFRWRNLYVRSLIATKRFDAALAAANSDEADPPGKPDLVAHHFYAALTEAAAGHVRQAAELIETCLGEGYTLGEFYTDWIGGPALRGEAFSDWRKSHPDPAAATRPASRPTTTATPS